MFDIGFWEIMVITLVALLVVGPERLPGLARELGRFVGKARRFVNSVRSDIEQELQTEELRKMLKSQEDEIQQLKTIMRDTEGQLRGEIESASQPLQTDIEETRKSLQLELDPSPGENPSRDAQRPTDKRADPKQSWDRPSVVPRVPVNGLLGENLETEHPLPVRAALVDGGAEQLAMPDNTASSAAVEGSKEERPEQSPELSQHADYRSDAAQWGDIDPPAPDAARDVAPREKG
jgi:sec-independent protein translocase protein TatB